MELQLRGFRCYENHTFTFDQGVTLVNGKSGVGKSTIADAILYVVHGSKKVKKPYSHGKKRCSVRWRLSDAVEIFRQSGPARVQIKVNETTFEGEEAQHVINQLVGTPDDFVASSYLRQGKKCTLMTGTNAEKMGIIRNISFRDDNVEIVHNKLRAACKEADAVLNAIDRKRDLAINTLKMFDRDNPQVLTSTLDAASINMSSFESELAITNNEVQNTRQALDIILGLEAKLKTLEGMVFEEIDRSKLEAEADELNKERAEIQLKLGEIAKAKGRLEALAKLRQHTEQRKQTLTAKQVEIGEILTSLGLQLTSISVNTDIESKITHFTKVIEDKQKLDKALAPTGISSFAELDTHVNDLYPAVRRDNGHIANLKISLNNKNWNEEQSNVQACPKCNAGLKIVGGVLQLHGDTAPALRAVEHQDVTEEMIKKLEIEVANKITQRDRFAKIRDDARLLDTAAKAYVEGDEKRLNDCKRAQSMLTEIKLLEEELASTDGQSDHDEVASSNTSMEDGYKIRISEIEKRNQEIHSSLLNETRRSEHFKQVQQVKAEIGDRNSPQARVMLQQAQQKISDIQERKRVAGLIIRRTSLLRDRDEVQGRWTKASERCSNLARLQEQARQVERDVLEQTVTTLNHEMDKHLKIMFPDDPMTVEFKTTKDNKSGTKSMRCSLVIYYKNVQYDDADQLSGGERDRVSLAMVLALNHLVDSDILILDETLSTLNAELKMSIVEMLREYCGEEKNMIVISHEGVEGVYNHVISLGGEK